MKLIAKLVIIALFIIALSQSAIVPGISVTSFSTAFIVSLILGIINVFIRPVIVFLTLPITVFSLGLFIFVINAFLFWLVSALVPGFEVSGFLTAFLGALLISVVSWLIDRFI